MGIFAGLADSGGYRGAQLLFGPVQVALNALRIAVMPLLARARAAGSGELLLRRGLIAGAGAAVAVLAWGTAALALPDTIGRELLGQSWSSTHELLLPMLCAQTMAAFGLGALLILRTAEALQSTFSTRVMGATAIFGLGTAGAWADGGVAASAGVALGATMMTAGLWWRARGVGSAAMVPVVPEHR